MGGENVIAVRVLAALTGSSPRGRGKHVAEYGVAARVRLIPAWAGKTGLNAWSGAGVWAHPRVGGENSKKTAGGMGNRGSSPRGRGKLGLRDREARSVRLIPAWAGKTSSSLRVCSRARAHPRVGGENQAITEPLIFVGGSSPRGRGKQVIR